MEFENAESPVDPPRFAAGTSVTVIATGQQGTVVYNARRDGAWLPMVDQPHSHGILRRHYQELELR